MTTLLALLIGFFGLGDIQVSHTDDEGEPVPCVNELAPVDSAPWCTGVWG